MAKNFMEGEHIEYVCVLCSICVHKYMCMHQRLCDGGTYLLMCIMYKYVLSILQATLMLPLMRIHVGRCLVSMLTWSLPSTDWFKTLFDRYIKQFTLVCSIYMYM